MSPTIHQMLTAHRRLRRNNINRPQNYDILAKMLCFCLSFSAMKEKMPNTLLDVFTFCACTKKSVNLLEDFSNVFFNTLKNIEK
jgi:hypothetical protein